MMTEIKSDYLHKYNVLRNYLHLIVHEAMKMQPTQQFENIVMLRFGFATYSLNY